MSLNYGLSNYPRKKREQVSIRARRNKEKETKTKTFGQNDTEQMKERKGSSFWPAKCLSVGQFIHLAIVYEGVLRKVH